MNKEELIKRVDLLMALGQSVTATKHTILGDRYVSVDQNKFFGFRSASLSFIISLYGTSHPYYSEFDRVKEAKLVHTLIGVEHLRSIKNEIELGWLISIKQLVTAEVFADFLEMSEHLLAEGYKDAAAVMIGSTLEEHLRQLCFKHNVETTFMKAGDLAPKKADVLNADLKKAEVYGPIEQKLVTAWLGLRNSAAHGNYSEYTKEQVQVMYQGVLGFISQTK